MQDKCFLDSNLWIYLYSSDHPKIKNAIESVLRSSQNNIIVSTQTLGETYNVLTKKMSLPEAEALTIITDIAHTVDVYELSKSDIFEAIRISQKYHYSFWDSLIIQAAIMTQCSVLYSEDMQDGQLIESKLTIINPLANV